VTLEGVRDFPWGMKVIQQRPFKLFERPFGAYFGTLLSGFL